MIVKYIRPSIFSRASVLSAGHNILVRVPNGEIYVFSNPDNPAPHQKTESICVDTPICVQSIFEEIDKAEVLNPPKEPFKKQVDEMEQIIRADLQAAISADIKPRLQDDRQTI